MKDGAGVIYMLTNTITGERYVGRTVDFARRMREYARGEGHGDIGKTIAKYGWENFSVEKLEQGISDADLPSREDYHVAKLDPELNLMTSTAGGRMRHAESTKELIRQRHLGKPLSQERRAKISASQTGERNHNFGKSPSLETRAKMRKAKLGKTHSPEHRANNSASKLGERNHNFGKKMSSKQRAKISASKRGKKLSPQHCANISSALRGRKQSPEHVANRVAATKRSKSREG